MEKMSETYKAKSPPIAIRLLTVVLLFISVIAGFFKLWEISGLSFGVLLIVVILVCYQLLSKTIDERFDNLEKLIELKDENSKDDQKQ